MTDDRSNSATTFDALLESLKAFAAEAEEYERRKREAYLQAREVILEMKRVGPKKLTSNRAIAKAMGRSPNWVDKVVAEEWTATDGGTPFAGGREQVMTELLNDSKARRQFEHELKQGVAAQKPKAARPPRGKPTESVLRATGRDHIVMGDHVLFVGDSRNPHLKWKLLHHLGRTHSAEAADPDKNGVGVELDIVVVTDPPYGQDEPGVPNDHIAVWDDVYKLFKPRGGFSFAAFRPDELRAAEEGIIKADGKPVHYMAMQTGAAWGYGPENRLPNHLQAVVYWERKGEVWIRGRKAVSSVLRANAEALADLNELEAAGLRHPTAKPFNVMADLIELVTEPGDYVLDPFAGGGSTLMACERAETGRRRFIGIELTPSYAESAAQRWEDYTGRKAIVHRVGTRHDPKTVTLDEYGSGTLTLDEVRANPAWGGHDGIGSNGVWRDGEKFGGIEPEKFDAWVQRQLDRYSSAS